MALVVVKGMGEYGLRINLGKSDELMRVVCEAIGEDPNDPDSYSVEVLPTASFCKSTWDIYLEVACNPDEDRERRGAEIARTILDHLKEKFPRCRSGVWFNRKFWVSCERSKE